MGNEYDFTREHFEAKAVSRGEFEALKRFGEYEELHDGTLMRIEGVKEFRIYCEDVEGCPFHVVTPGFQRALQEAYPPENGERPMTTQREVNRKLD